jgi:hypothetical protein
MWKKTPRKESDRKEGKFSKRPEVVSRRNMDVRKKKYKIAWMCRFRVWKWCFNGKRKEREECEERQKNKRKVEE